jgi:phosphoglycerate dehydrogenase-like enzyme
VLDVTDPEPPLPGGITTLENVIVFPHIAGSLGRECRRMGRWMVDELDRFLTGKPLRNAVTPERLATMA